jgi:hypothetical protein
MIDETPSYSHSINRRQSSFNLSNLADVPKQLTTTLAKPISSFHSQTTKHIHSPNDVVNKLLQSFNLQNPPKVNILSEKAGGGGGVLEMGKVVPAGPGLVRLMSRGYPPLPPFAPSLYTILYHIFFYSVY